MTSSATASKRCRLLRLSLFHREDSSSEVFTGPDSPSPDKQDPVQMRHPRQPYQQMAARPRSQSGSDSPQVKKLPYRPHSVCWDTLAGLRGKKNKVGLKGSAGGQDSPFMKDVDTLHHHGKRKGLLSSSSSSPAGLMRASTSSSVDEVDWGDVARGGGGSGGGGGGSESGYYGSEEGGSKSGGTPSPGTPLSPLQSKDGLKVVGFPTPHHHAAHSPRGARNTGGGGHVRSSSSPSTFSATPSSTSSPSPSPMSSGLQEVDIVGESSRCRFPWQRDVAVQCSLGLYDFPGPPRRSRQDRSSSSSSYSGHSLAQSSTDHAPPPPPPHSRDRSVGQEQNLKGNRHTKLGNSASLPGVSSTEPSHVTRRANFSRKPRPSSMGSLENLRFQNELTRFRELVSLRGERGRGESPPLLQSPPASWRRLRGERKVDPPVLQSPPGGWRRAPSVFQEDGDSVSDLESILEYPDECHSDLSCQTSVASFDADDQQLHQHDCDLVGDLTETADVFRPPGNVRHSPSVSPPLWTGVDDGDVSDSDRSEKVPMDGAEGQQRTAVRMRRTKLPRRRSSGSITSGSENESGEHEPSPPLARRGRRSAIYETKNCGDVSPTTLSPDYSPSNSCDEGESASNIAERLRRRRSSVDLSMNIYPGDLLIQQQQKKLIKRNTIAEFYVSRSAHDGASPASSEDASKKARQPFSLLKLKKTRSKESLIRLEDTLRRLKPSEFKDNHLAAYKTLHWSDLIASTDKQNQPISISGTERKRREAVWELFKSECVFLIDHCMVLKHCFMEPLKKVQVEGKLMYAEPQDIFGNLDELCYVSYTFCKDFIAALLKDMSVTDFGRTRVLIKAFQRFSTHSKDGAVYHTYCINYANALTYLEKLRQNPEFAEFERWCEQDSRCKRLQLTDLLVAPVQHCTKLPLLLANVARYTESETDRCLVNESIDSVKTSLQQLEEKMKWLKNVERVQEIQRQIVWPAVADLDPRCIIPDCLKSTLARQPCERLLTCTQRQLLHEGPLTLMESPKTIDVHLFLFDDLLLITKPKKPARKKQGTEGGSKSPSGAEGAGFVVFRQPLALDRFTLHDIPPPDASANGLKQVLVLVHLSRFQQVLGVFTLQASCDSTKVTWVNAIREAQDSYADKQQQTASTQAHSNPPPNTHNHHHQLARTTQANGEGHGGGGGAGGGAGEEGGGAGRAGGEFPWSPTRRALRTSGKRREGPTKSRSMDAVYM
ncbi:uncharacterized protein LOC143284454 isoform X2 [Babylonia areolata]|uniref:uncharacterized protein LOC143284454 isoform X2 n=1 Tax=Babylonia areolata TaxID=304850 RepID=UPI003FD622BE